MATTIISREIMGMANRAGKSHALCRRSSRIDQSKIINRTKAKTPFAPTRLSFMISNMRSRERPENSPSIVSMKPSQ